MTPVLDAFKQLLSNNQLSSHYTGQLFASLDETLKSELTDILQRTIQRYTAIPVVRAVLDSDTNPASHLKTVFDILPTTFFLISNELYREPAHFKSAKLLQIAGIASTITRPADQDAHIRLLLESIDPEATQDALMQKIMDENTDDAYLPKIIFNDFTLIRKHYKNLVLTKDIHELIDMMFAFQGLLQIFLRYYFELVCEAQSDEGALHIDKLFSNLFATLRYQEIKYWNNYTDSRTLQNELFHIIRMDAPAQRHPVLRKHLFDSLKQYNPLFKDARSRYTAPDVRQMHMAQLDRYNALSVPRLAVLLRTVGRCKGRSNLVYLLSQTLKSQNQKLYQLNEYVQSEVFEKDRELVELVQYFVEKLSSTQKRSNRRSSRSADMGAVIQTAESMRKLRAKKLLEEREAKGGLSYEQVNRLMQEKFKKMYKQAKDSGKLTSDSASDRVTEFAAAAQPLFLASSEASRNEAIEDFKISTQQMLKEITDRGHLTDEEIKTFKIRISAANKKLADADPDAQAEIMEQIGMAISNAADRSQKRYEKKIKNARRPPKKQKALTYDQVTRFLEDRLSALYKRVKKDGALTQDKVSSYLSKFSDSAQPLMLDLSAEQQKVEIKKLKSSTDDILNTFSKEGALSKDSLKQYKDDVQKLTIELDTSNVEKRAEVIEKIGLTLSDASREADRNREASGLKTLYTKALTQDQVPEFIETYLQKLYARSRKSGALTYDQVSKYLSQFADAAQHIVIDIPPAQRRQSIETFRNSTDDILAGISRDRGLSRQQVHKITIELHGQIDKLDVDEKQERIEIVDQIGLILADASETKAQTSNSTFDEEFYKKECIPFGLDNPDKYVSMDSFFSFPFGDRKGPNENDWFNYHIRYLQMAVDKNKLEKPTFDKISAMLPHVPKKKYRKYFNIFPGDKFEETTFHAVYDLWQNKALDRLLVES